MFYAHRDTRCNIYQIFRQRMKGFVIMTPSLSLRCKLNILNFTYSYKKFFRSFENWNSWSRLCVVTHFCNDIDFLTQHCFLKITCSHSSATDPSRDIFTNLKIRSFSFKAWCRVDDDSYSFKLRRNNVSYSLCFLKLLPDLQQNPIEEIIEPSKIDDITKHTQS